LPKGSAAVNAQPARRKAAQPQAHPCCDREQCLRMIIRESESIDWRDGGKIETEGPPALTQRPGRCLKLTDSDSMGSNGKLPTLVVRIPVWPTGNGRARPSRQASIDTPPLVPGVLQQRPHVRRRSSATTWLWGLCGQSSPALHMRSRQAPKAGDLLVGAQ
jgi:hypothetical protein